MPNISPAGSDSLQRFNLLEENALFGLVFYSHYHPLSLSNGTISAGYDSRTITQPFCLQHCGDPPGKADSDI